MMRFEEALDNYHDEIYRYLYRRCLASGGPEPASTAADLTQDTFERAYKAYDQLRADSNVRAWLYAIASNRARDHHRRRQTSEKYTPKAELEPQGTSPEHQVQTDLMHRKVLAALRTLPEKQRRAVSLRYLGELEYADIGQILSCSTESARANVYQGLKRLQRQLNHEPENDHDQK